MTIQVERYTGDGSAWDAFVRAQPSWTHFHLYGWRRVLERVFGHECIYLEARDEAGDRAAVMPLVRVRSLLFGHYLVSMPFANYGGPLGTPAGVRALVHEASELARADRVRLLELRSRAPLPTDLPVSHRKITVLLDLPATAAELWGRLPSKVRSQVRRPQKAGVEVRIGLDQLEPFHAVFAEHMRDLGTPAQSLAFFRALAEEFPGDLRLACAWLDGQPIACGCGFRWDDEFEMTWASALRAHKQLSANMLVYWAMMEHAVGDGARVFNFGRCSPGGGTHHFKQQWCGRDEPLWWYQCAADPGALAATPAPDQSRYLLATKIWRRVPLAVATRLGAAIARNIP